MYRSITAAAVVLLVACSSDDRAIVGTVRQYNNSLVTVFRTGDSRSLRQVATTKETGKVTALVDIKRDARLVLESEMTAFEVISVDRTGPSGAAVRTKEIWRYHDRPLEPGRAHGTQYVARMSMQYDLERDGDTWRVARARTVTNEFLEPRGVRVAGAGHGERRD